MSLLQDTSHLIPLHLMGDRASNTLNPMEDNSSLETAYIPQTHLWEHWSLADHLTPPGISGDGSTTAKDVYTQTSPLFESSVYCCDVELTDRWKYISPMIDSTYWRDGLDLTMEYADLLSVSKHIIAKELPHL